MKDALINCFNGSDGLDSDLEILSLQQQPNEQTASFFTRFLRASNNKGYPESLLVSIALKGLNSDIRQIVMPQNHRTIENIRKAASLAEKTLASTNHSNIAATFSDIVSQQIKGLADKINRLESRDWEPTSEVPTRTRQQRYRPPQPDYEQPTAVRNVPQPSPLRDGQSTNRTGCQRCGEGREAFF